MSCSHCGIIGHNIRTCPLLKMKQVYAVRKIQQFFRIHLKQKLAARVIQRNWRMYRHQAKNLFKQHHSNGEEEGHIQMCPICCEIIGSNCAKTICGHFFCTECLLRSSQENGNCPLCRNVLVPPNSKKFTQNDLLEAEQDGIRQGFFDAQELLREEVQEREREIYALKKRMTSFINVQDILRAEVHKRDTLISSLQTKLKKNSWWMNDYSQRLHHEENEHQKTIKNLDHITKLVNHLRDERDDWRLNHRKAIDVSIALNKQLMCLVNSVSGKDCPKNIIEERISQAKKMHSNFYTWKESIKNDRLWSILSCIKPDPIWEEWKKSWPIPGQRAILSHDS
jgi:hypothetical protein